MIKLTSEALRAIASHAESTYPEECVGLLIGHIKGDIKYVTVTYAVENRWHGQVSLAEDDDGESLHDRFYLDPRDYLRADREARNRQLDIVGCYHSHPDHPARPSARDLTGAEGVGGGGDFAFVIQSVRKGSATEVTSWLLVDDGTRFEQEELVEEYTWQ